MSSKRSFFCTEFAEQQWTEILYVSRNQKIAGLSNTIWICESSTLASALHNVPHSYECTSTYSLFPFIYKITPQVNFSNLLVCMSYTKYYNMSNILLHLNRFSEAPKKLMLRIQKYKAGLFLGKSISFKGRIPGMNCVSAL